MNNKNLLIIDYSNFQELQNILLSYGILWRLSYYISSKWKCIYVTFLFAVLLIWFKDSIFYFNNNKILILKTKELSMLIAGYNCIYHTIEFVMSNGCAKL